MQKRAKLFSLFSKFNVQNMALQYILDDGLEETVKRFIKKLYRLDAWSAVKFFPALKNVKEELDYFIQYGITKLELSIIEDRRKEGEDVDERIWEAPFSSDLISFYESQKYSGIRRLWNMMCNCEGIFEDVIREYFLPSYLQTIG